MSTLRRSGRSGIIVALAVMIGGIPSELRSQELPLKRPKLTPITIACPVIPVPPPTAQQVIEEAVPPVEIDRLILTQCAQGRSVQGIIGAIQFGDPGDIGFREQPGKVGAGDGGIQRKKVFEMAELIQIAAQQFLEEQQVGL